MSVPGHARATLSIGEVLAHLRPEFPDVTISKIRFLEAEGLVHPDRAPSGYRKFSTEDVTRLRYVLGQQRDHYLPLRVIRERLDAIDRRLEPPDGGRDRPRALFGPRPALAGDGRRVPPARMSRDELLDHAGLGADGLSALEQFGLVAPGPGGHYDHEALIIARAVAEMARYGIEPRHLRGFRTAADREIGLIEQVVLPLTRQKTPDARVRAAEAVRELAALSVRLHTALVRAGLAAELGG